MSWSTAGSMPSATESPAIREAGRDLLSLALVQARNRTLALLAGIEAAQERTPPPAPTLGASHPEASPQWLAGHIGWFTEYWIGRNTQRRQGEDCPPTPTRLASIEPQADRWWHPDAPAADGREAADLPDAEATRAWLLETLEGTLELLSRADETDAGLYFFRLALLHEDLRAEHLVELAQARGLALGTGAGESEALPAARAPIALPATRWQLGTPAGGFRFDNESGHDTVDVPEFEIDAQPVSWSQFVEFVQDGGYDRAELWHPEGWRWLGASGRRAPLHVEQIGTASGAVLQSRFGRMMRVNPRAPALHVTWWEADAWARWAGRRLASEVEWEIAAHRAGGRGFQWGQVHEWVANTFVAWPGFRPGPWADYSQPWFGRARAMRGGSDATSPRLKHPRLRGFALPAHDHRFSGFRTCAF